MSAAPRESLQFSDWLLPDLADALTHGLKVKQLRLRPQDSIIRHVV